MSRIIMFKQDKIIPDGQGATLSEEHLCTHTPASSALIQLKLWCGDFNSKLKLKDKWKDVIVQFKLQQYYQSLA